MNEEEEEEEEEDDDDDDDDDGGAPLDPPSRHTRAKTAPQPVVEEVSGRAVSTTRGACRTARADEVGTHAQLPS